MLRFLVTCLVLLGILLLGACLDAPIQQPKIQFDDQTLKEKARVGIIKPVFQSNAETLFVLEAEDKRTYYLLDSDIEETKGLMRYCRKEMTVWGFVGHAASKDYLLVTHWQVAFGN